MKITNKALIGPFYKKMFNSINKFKIKTIINKMNLIHNRRVYNNLIILTLDF
jgi:hypothetical protein